MARHANVTWELPEGHRNSRGGDAHKWYSVHAAVLMDIRDELQTLNRLLAYVSFISIPGSLRKIARNTTKRKTRRQER